VSYVWDNLWARREGGTETSAKLPDAISVGVSERKVESVAMGKVHVGSAFAKQSQALHRSGSVSGELTGFMAKIQQLVADDDAFATFRRDEVIMYVLETTVHDHVAREFFTHMRDRFPGLLKYMHLFQTSDAIGQPNVIDTGVEGFPPLSFQTADYAYVVGKWIAEFPELLPPNNPDILEIGVGYGGHCKIVHDVLTPSSYTLVDIPEALALADRFLVAFPYARASAVFLPADALEHAGIDATASLPLLPKYDFCFSNYAFSELNLQWRHLYFELVLRRCRRGYISDNGYGGHTVSTFPQAHSRYGGIGLVRALREAGHRNVKMGSDTSPLEGVTGNLVYTWGS
jgi:hypothetical protein